MKNIPTITGTLKTSVAQLAYVSRRGRHPQIYNSTDSAGKGNGRLNVCMWLRFKWLMCDSIVHE